ncbi:tetratricopeptide repeat protein [Dactylosporangium darangshiense]|uniref:FxSxx-COOH system tetratricopeptide repeat protein n=1 Tax=Dactylosporangium darangshiense TaxID=579108 RepID=A0ABP8DV41_9ACTN
MTAGSDPRPVSVQGGQGLQVGDHNLQTNLHMDASTLPPAQRVAGDGVVHNLPLASGVFVGRDLAMLAGLLRGGAGGAVVGQAAVHGLGGIGKTELVLQYAREYAGRYRLVWWVTADTPENVALGLAALTRRLHPVATLADAQEWAVGWLQSNRGWLLVLDNVERAEDITGLLGQVMGQGHVVVTTRRDLGRARWLRLRLSPLRLDVLDRAASVALLTELTGLRDAGAADRLAADLGDLPLALEQAGAYISQHDGLGCDGYRALLATQFAQAAADGGEGGDAQRTVASVWQVTMHTVRARSPLADQVMRVLGWLAPEALPDDVLLPLADNPAALGDALALLASYSMIGRSAGSVGVHRLVQAVTRAGTPADDLDEAVRLLEAALPDDPISNVAGWPRWNELLPHIDAVLAHLPSTHENATAFYIGGRAATYRQFQGQIAEAVAAFEQLLIDRRRVLGEDHPDTLATRNNLAAAYQEAGRVPEAVAAFEQLLPDLRRVLGEDHPDTLAARNNLAYVYRDTGRVAEAVAAFEQLLLDFRRVLGEDHPDTLTTRNNLAAAYRTAGRVAEAVAVFEQLLTDRRRVLGEDHPNTLATRAHLAAAYRAAGRVAEAVAAVEQLLTDRRRVLGEDHPNTLDTRAHLAAAYRAAGRVAEAVAVFEQLLPDRRRALGEDHPDTLATRAHLAYVHQEAGRVAEAVAVFEQLLPDTRRALGEDHPDTLDTRAHLAAAYRAAGRVAEAVAVFEQLLPDRRRVLGEDHPDTLATRNNLAYVYRDAGRVTEAVAVFEQLLTDRRRVLGEDHPNTLATRANLAAARAAMDEPDDGSTVRA